MENSSGVLSGPFAGRYTIERVLGRGATATVFLAHDSESDRKVAIKILKPELAESIGSHRFLREIRLTQKLHHPHIVPVLDSGEYERKLYFVLPLMDGGTLRDRLNRERQLAVPEAVAIAQDVASALEYAHKAGVIHRDVKPENILLAKDGVCLADFGIARAVERAVDESSTSTGIVRGTPAYMSPEQASGEHDYDGRSDIYSLACVLYEMLAGMHAFVGPTPKAVMAQRLLHSPRPVSVYRPSIPGALEAVLGRALEILPADRYASAREFSKALADSLRDPTPSSDVRRRRSTARVRVVAGSAFAVGLAAVAMVNWEPWKVGGRFGPKPDTTRIAIMPVEGDASAPRREAYDLLKQGFNRWQGVTLVDELTLRNSRDSDAPVSNEREAQDAALEAGAGRFVRSRVTPSGDGLRLWTGLFESQSGVRLAESSSLISRQMSGASDAIARSVDELLLRHSSEIDPGSRVLPAVQRLTAALGAIEAFDLTGADSLLTASLEADPKYARSALWLAQVRNWRLDEPDSWMTWAERANAGVGLTAREKEFAQALVAMGKRDFPDACRRYQSLKEKDERDFAVWYGLGQCHRQDDAVVPDSRSPSGWRFRSSSQQAAVAFERAFALAPAFHKNFEAQAYSDLRDLLYSRRSLLRPGVAVSPQKTRFLGYATLRADTIVHIPYPQEMVRRGSVNTDPVGRAASLAKQREVFRRLALSWAAALPKSPATKEALAVSLEMVGDERAVDTLRSARTLTNDRGLNLRLAAEEVFMRISFARVDIKHAVAAKLLADSLLLAVQSPSTKEAAVLAPVAVVVGNCGLAGKLAARSVSEVQARYMEVSLHVAAAAESLTVVSAMGCRSPSDTGASSSLLSAVTQSVSRDSVEYSLLGRAAILTYPLDSMRIARLAKISGDYVLEAQAAALARDGRTVRSILRTKQRVRPAGDVTPDAVYPESRAWLAIGQRDVAAEWLDPVLTRRGWLELMLNDPIGTGALLRSVILRAEVANALKDGTLARRYAMIVVELWANSDVELSPYLTRMQLIAMRNVGR
jgi:tRNA A-37 threonylcarbamoyl transferase component Bud32